MEKKKYSFSQKTTSYLFGADFSYLSQLTDPDHTVIITDENVFHAQSSRFRGWRSIVVPAGEEHKVQSTADHLINELIRHQADRKTMIVGVGGGVITDLAGYVASVYMRGVRFGFVPSTLLAMVDASIGGKNGIDVGRYKNLVGSIRQPEFLLYDLSLLQTLPVSEWVNGFAEVIKHACIRDAAMFSELESNDLSIYRKTPALLAQLVKRNATIKSDVVMADEFETGERKLLNFGHTWGHAIETMYALPHGHAIAIGMVVACRLSEELTGFKSTTRVSQLLEQYNLPVSLDVNRESVMEVLKMDKKKEHAVMQYVLLRQIGEGVIKSIPMEKLAHFLQNVTA